MNVGKGNPLKYKIFLEGLAHRLGIEPQATFFAGPLPGHYRRPEIHEHIYKFCLYL